MRFQNSSFLPRFPSTFASGGWSVNSNSNNSLPQSTCAKSQTSSSNTSLRLRTMLGWALDYLTPLVGEVRVSGVKLVPRKQTDKDRQWIDRNR